MERWETWPPAGHSERLSNYARYRQLFLGKHQEVYARVQQWLDREVDKAIVYIVCNFAGLVSRVSADLLFGEQPRFVVGDEDSAEQVGLDAIVNGNGLNALDYETALSASWRGDTVLKVRFGKRHPYSEKPEAIIEAVPSGIFFPHLDGDNVRQMTGATLAWVKQRRDKHYLRKEIHEPGVIRNELWELDGGRIKNQVKLSTLDEYRDLPEEQETGFSGLLAEYVPNWRMDDDFWGISDYVDLEGLFDEINNRVSRISRVLDKHESPKLVLPPGVMKFDPVTKRYYVEKEALDVVEVEPGEAGDLPKYLVWDAQLEAAFKQIEKLLEILFLTSETSPDVFGLGKNGAAESGRALKFRLLRTLAKVNRKKLYFDQALKNVLYAAQVLDTVHGAGRYRPAIPRIEWADGLPQDSLEAAQVEQTRLAAGNTSLESSVRRMDGLDGKALQEEMDRIKKNQEPRLATPTGPRVSLQPPAGAGEG